MKRRTLLRTLWWGTVGALAVAAIALATVGTLAPTMSASANTGTTRINMYSYGSHSVAYDARLLNIRPAYLIDNTAHGYWGEYTRSYSSSSLLQNVAGMKAAGMKVIGYTSSGYEGRGGGAPASMTTLDLVKKQVYNMARLDGVDGVFIDETDGWPNAAQKDYLKQLSDYAHSLGVSIWANPGVNSFDPWYFNAGGYDFVQSTEQWRGAALSSVQLQYGSHISVAGFAASYTVDDAVRLTQDAWNKGIKFCYINTGEYTSMAPWFEDYAARLRALPGGTIDTGSGTVPSPTPTPTPTPIPPTPPTPVTLQILRAVASGPDDGFGGSRVFTSTASWLEAGSPRTRTGYGAWFRFNGITIPAGAKVTQAHLEIVAGTWKTGTALKIRAEKSADPSPPASVNDLNARRRTTAGVDWDTGYADGAWHNSPDFAPVVQELLNRYRYTGSQSIQVFVDNDRSAAGAEATAPSFEGGCPPRLFIEYSK